MTEGFMVLYQKQILVAPGVPPARTATVFPLGENALEKALTQIRYNFKPWAVSFKKLPPQNLLLRACDEAVREGRGVALPLATKPRSRDNDPLRNGNGLLKGAMEDA